VSNTPDTAAALKYCTATMPAEDWCAYMAKTCQKIETQRDEARAEVERLRKREVFAKDIITNFLNCLPLRRDWLDPVVEQMAKEFLQPEIIGWKPAATSPEIFEAEGKEWYRHTPGDECPCDIKQQVKCLTSKEGETATSTAVVFGWEVKNPNETWWGLIIGWRPADAPEKLERK